MEANKKLFLIFSLMILLLPIVFSENIIVENFDYSTNFASHGWTVWSKGCGINVTPIHGTFGIDQDYYCPSGNGGFTILKNLSAPLSGQVNVYFQLNNSKHDGVSRTYLSQNSILATHTSSTFNNKLMLYFRTSNNKAGLTNLMSGGTGQNDINGGLIGWHEINMTLNLASKLYKLYIDGLPVFNGTIESGNSTFDAFTLSVEYDANANISFWFDNLIVWNEVANLTNSYPEGMPCSNDDDCISGKCVNNQCTLKDFLSPCSSGIECISGVCFQGSCSKPSLSESLTFLKHGLFGTDSLSSDIISITIMLILALITVFFISKWTGGNFSAGGLLGAAIFFISGFLFTAMGWLSAWITFGMIFLMVVGGIIILVVKSSQGGG